MIKLSSNYESTQQDIQAVQNSMQNALRETTGAGLENKLLLGLAQLDRFVAANIQVQTGRTKNSIFQRIGRSGNSVAAGLHTNVKYSPYVGHLPGRSSEQFFKYAARVEGLRVANSVGQDIVITVEGKFT